MSVLQIKKGDRYPSIVAVLTVNGAVLSLTGCTVKFIGKLEYGTEVIGGDAAVVDAAAGIVRYDQTDEDVANAGIYLVEWQVTLPSLKKLTIPSGGYDRLVIDADLGD